jgi:hypothetical protein
VAPHIAAGLRASLLASRVIAADGGLGPGLLVLAEDFSIVSRTPLADRWLAEISIDSRFGGELPPAVYAVAARLRALERGLQVEPDFMPRIRLQTSSGR